MNWIDIASRLLSVLAWIATPYLLITAIVAYNVGFFVGVNAIDWTPECTEDAGRDRWFSFWARVGIRQGAKRR